MNQIMDKFNLLDCTLRDGGYITNWEFNENLMRNMISGLVDANMDYIEIGYLNNKPYIQDTAIFNNINQISILLPENKKESKILAMADVTQFFPENITPCNGMSIDGIRVVFYKHQIEDAIKLCESVKQNGYRLFVQPMVTIDYTIDEYTKLIKKITSLNPYAVAIVDSFGYMIKQDFRKYFNILDNILPADVLIGFHSHNNMQLAFITAQDILDYETTRSLIIDASLYGMGRGAGNLNTELIVNYYNMNLGYKYNILKIIDLISKYIMPFTKVKKWGYSPYFFLTGLYHCHPNFASYLLEKHDISVADFKEFLEIIPPEMRTKCRKPYVEELYQIFIESTK
jgi:4-hydroxy 2-oxovalerate aldolase